jgi:hypothetical protein
MKVPKTLHDPHTQATQEPNQNSNLLQLFGLLDKVDRRNKRTINAGFNEQIVTCKTNMKNKK